MSRPLTARIHQSADPFESSSDLAESIALNVFLEDGDINSVLSHWFRGGYSDAEMIDKLNSLKASAESSAEDSIQNDYLEGA